MKRVVVVVLLVIGIILVVGAGDRTAQVGAQSSTPWINVIYSSADPLGARHIVMDTRYGPNCQQCHDGIGQSAPKNLVGVPFVNMGNGQQCTSCHDGKYVGQLFLSQMNVNNRFYSCSDCHQVQ
jgi:cytochrome c7-like protein